MRKVRQRSTSTVLRQFISARVPSLGEDRAPGIPVVVNSGDGGVDALPEEEDDENYDVELPSVEEFSFNSVIEHVKEESDALVDSILNSIRAYRKDLTTELQDVTKNQEDLTQKMEYVDTLAVQTLRNTQTRAQKAESQLHSLKGVDELTTAAEDTYETLTNILFLLNDIDQMLPERERLKPTNSPHKTHYPDLHELMRAPKTSRATLAVNGAHTLKPRRSVSLSALNNYTARAPTMNLRSIPPESSPDSDHSPATIQGLPLSESESASVTTMVQGNTNNSEEDASSFNGLRTMFSRKTSDTHELQSAESRLRRIMES
jgi:hypothetical protein